MGAAAAALAIAASMATVTLAAASGFGNGFGCPSGHSVLSAARRVKWVSSALLSKITAPSTVTLKSPFLPGLTSTSTLVRASRSVSAYACALGSYPHDWQNSILTGTLLAQPDIPSRGTLKFLRIFLPILLQPYPQGSSRRRREHSPSPHTHRYTNYLNKKSRGRERRCDEREENDVRPRECECVCVRGAISTLFPSRSVSTRRLASRWESPHRSIYP